MYRQINKFLVFSVFFSNILVERQDKILVKRQDKILVERKILVKRKDSRREKRFSSRTNIVIEQLLEERRDNKATALGTALESYPLVVAVVD